VYFLLSVFVILILGEAFNLNLEALGEVNLILAFGDSYLVILAVIFLGFLA
jgi:hypothetical protein